MSRHEFVPAGEVDPLLPRTRLAAFQPRLNLLDLVPGLLSQLLRLCCVYRLLRIAQRLPPLHDFRLDVLELLVGELGLHHVPPE